MPFCPGGIVLCNDNTCLKYQNHYSCIGHPFHLGDRIKRNGKFGYIYDVNPLNSKRSFTINYDDDTKEKVFGFYTCATIEKIVAPRDLSRIHPRYQ